MQTTAQVQSEVHSRLNWFTAAELFHRLVSIKHLTDNLANARKHFKKRWLNAHSRRVLKQAWDWSNWHQAMLKHWPKSADQSLN